jgi:hypothetical protein
MTEAAPPPVDLSTQNVLIVHAVGENLMAWASLEFELHELFVRQLIFESTNKNRYTIARSVWSAILAFDDRLKMVDAAMQANIANEQIRADWRLLFNYTKKMSTFRNEAAHGMVANYDHKEMMIMPYATSIPVKKAPLSITELKRRTSLFIALHENLQWLSLRMSLLLKPNAELEARKTPDLIETLRKQADRTRASQRKGPASTDQVT